MVAKVCLIWCEPAFPITSRVKTSGYGSYRDVSLLSNERLFHILKCPGVSSKVIVSCVPASTVWASQPWQHLVLSVLNCFRCCLTRCGDACSAWKPKQQGHMLQASLGCIELKMQFAETFYFEFSFSVSIQSPSLKFFYHKWHWFFFKTCCCLCSPIVL